jgi:hypothetical protein
MSRDGPLIESARRAPALKANQDPHQTMAAAVSSEMLDEVGVITDFTMPKASDAFLYGQDAAKILSDCIRAVAPAPTEKRTIALQEAPKKIGEAVADQWLPEAMLMNRLDIPVSKSAWSGRHQGWHYPKPVKLGPRITAWRVEDIRPLIECSVGSK